MNKIIIIGNLVRDTDLRTLDSGVSVCTFTVAVNKRKKAGDTQEAEYFRVSVWREKGETCHKYLKKGKKVMVMGAVSSRVYKGNDGVLRSQMEITADDVEFLSPKDTSEAPDGYTEVTGEELPFD